MGWLGGHLHMASVQMVLSIGQTRLQKGLIADPDQVSHFRHRGRVGSVSGISTDSHLCHAEQRKAGFGKS